MKNMEKPFDGGRWTREEDRLSPGSKCPQDPVDLKLEFCVVKDENEKESEKGSATQ